jgi:hypothetical protein
MGRTALADDPDRYDARVMNVMSAQRVEFEQPLDYRDEIRAPVGEARFLVIPERRYLMIDGSGMPGGPEFADSMTALYPVAYTLHFALKKRGLDAPVGTLEGLFSFDAPVTWRLMLPVPAVADAADIAAAIQQVRERKTPARIDQLRVEPWTEGRVAQIMHVGPYDAEQATIAALHAAIEGRGLRPRGRHHEIYISDPNRTAPGRLKTVIRQPVDQA